VVKLNTLVKQIKSARDAANSEWNGDFKYRAGQEMAKAEAKVALPKLELEFSLQFKNVGFPVFVKGNLPTLATEMSKQTETVAIDFSQVYNDLFTVVKASIGNSKVFGPSQFALLVRTLRQMAVQNGIASIPNVDFVDSVVVNTDKELQAQVSMYVEKMTAMALTTTILTNMATKEALLLEHEASTIPVLIFNSSKVLAEKLGPSLFTGKFLYIQPKDKENLDEAYVTNLLQTIKKTVNTKE
jgi:hypothetical protein